MMEVESIFHIDGLAKHREREDVNCAMVDLREHERNKCTNVRRIPEFGSSLSKFGSSADGLCSVGPISRFSISTSLSSRLEDSA